MSGEVAPRKVFQRVPWWPGLVYCEPGRAALKIREKMRGCVAFIGADIKGETKPVGTCFFVSRPSARYEGNWGFSYLVTAKHLITGIEQLSSSVYVRLNPKDPDLDAQWFPTEPSEWTKHKDDSVDVALHRNITMELLDHVTFPLYEALGNPDPKASVHHQISLDYDAGDEVFSIGLFTNRYGIKRNIPIVRAGIIAAMPGEKITWKGLPTDGYLIETRSIGGLSGSPVFLYQERRMAGAPNYWLLGLIRGHYSVEPDDVLDADKAVAFEALEEYGEDALEKVNKGISLVTPIGKLFDVIENVRQEDDAEEDAIHARGQVEDAAPPSAFDAMVARIAQVPKAEVDDMERNRPKRKRKSEG